MFPAAGTPICSFVPNVTFSLRTWLDIHRGLNSLDATKEGQDIISLDYDPATRMLILRNAEAINREKVLFDRIDREKASTHQVVEGMEVTVENAARVDAYRREVEAAKDVEVEIAVTKISLAKLLRRPDGKTNRPAQSVLNRLAPILED